MSERKALFEFTFTLAEMTREEAEAIFEAAADAVYERTQSAVGYFTTKAEEE